MNASFRSRIILPLVLLLALAPAWGSSWLAASAYADSETIDPPASSGLSVQSATYDDPGAGDPAPADPAHAGPAHLRIARGPDGQELLTHNTATIEWDSLPNEADNEIDIWNADNDAWITWGNLTTHTVGNLKPETTYRIYITWNKDRPSLEYKSNVLEFTTLPDTSAYPEPPLTPPHDLRIVSLTDSSVTLKWKTSPGATGYDLYVNGAWKQGIWDGALDTVTYELPEDGRAAGTPYTFALGAQKAADGAPVSVSANSNAVTIAWGELAAPRDLQAVTATRTAAALGWAAVPGATSYDVYRDGVLVGTADSNRYTAEGLEAGRTYHFTVAARNALWTSQPSAEATVVPGADYNLVTYYTSWSIYGRGFQPSDIDAGQVTHINYAFADICWKGMGSAAKACRNDNVPLQQNYVFDGEMIVGDPDADLSNFAALNAMKSAHPNLKLLVSVGGWSWSNFFSDMAATEETRRAFANSVVQFLRAYGLDGLDIDWEYPVEGGEDDNSRRPEDAHNFTLLVETVREALDAAGAEDGKYYLQTIAAGQGDNFIVNANLAESAQYLDSVNLMTYDYSGSWQKLAAHNAPLYYDTNDPSEAAERNNVYGAVRAELGGGVPGVKLVVGVPFYGKGWAGCPANGQYRTCDGATSFGTWENGSFDFSDLEDHYADKNGYVRYWNEASKTAYLYNPDEKVFMTYNDRTSMMYVASFVQSLDLAGVMSWEISGDRNRTLSSELARDLPTGGVPNASALAAPSQPRVAAKSDTAITLAWEASPSATSYEVFADDRFAGRTTDTRWTLESLKPGSAHRLKVLAVTEEGGAIQAVSPFSAEIAETTATGVPSGSVPPAANAPKPEEGLLDASSVKDGGKTVLTVKTDAAVSAIKSSALKAFRIVADKTAQAADFIIPPEVMAAIAAKGDGATLSVVLGGAEFSLPVSSLPASSGLRIGIAPPGGEELQALTQALQAQGLTLRVGPLRFAVERSNADGTYSAIADADWTGDGPSRAFNASPADASRITGAVFVPALGEVRSVPTRTKPNADGTATAVLKDRGDRIYAVVESAAFDYGDVTAEWMKADAAAASAALIVSGESPTAFGPDVRVTRAQFVSMLVRALGWIPDRATGIFADVDPGSKYAADVELAKKLGLAQGVSDSRFDPDGAVTREQMAVLLANALRLAGAGSEAATASALDKFADRATIAPYAREALALLVDRDILRGVSPSALAPKAGVTKAQAAVVVMRMLRGLGGTE